jgi:hypothetical protein
LALQVCEAYNEVPCTSLNEHAHSSLGDFGPGVYQDFKASDHMLFHILLICVREMQVFGIDAVMHIFRYDRLSCSAWYAVHRLVSIFLKWPYRFVLFLACFCLFKPRSRNQVLGNR